MRVKYINKKGAEVITADMKDEYANEYKTYIEDVRKFKVIEDNEGDET